MEKLTLHNLRVTFGAKRVKRRVGRGNASGKGNYSGRGMKGQKARSGGKKKLGLRGVKTYLLRIPKTGGFRSLKPKVETVNISFLDSAFNNGDNVTPRILLNLSVVKSVKYGVKILGDGKLTKKLKIKANQFSKTAKDAIIKAGGSAEIIKKVKPKANKSNAETENK